MCMRKLVIFCICVAFNVACVFGQETWPEDDVVVIESGIKADVSFFNFQKSEAPGAVSVFTPGGTVGCLVNIWFKDWIGIQPELNLNFKQTVFGWENNSGKMQSFGVEVPIYVVARLDVFKRHHVFFGLGPYTEFYCYARWMIDDRNVNLLEIHESGEPMIQDTQSGMGAIVGYELGNGLSIDISYKLCYYNILQPNTSQGVSLYPQCVSFGLAYKFGRK